MATILGESSGASDGDQTPPEPRGSRAGAGEGAVSWEERPERVGIAFNLSKQVSTQLGELRRELELEGDVRPSRSEIAEVALRIAVEDARARGTKSELVKRLNERHAARDTGSTHEGGLTTGGPTALRSVDESGSIVETTYDENGQIVDENVVGRVADLPVEAEYVDEEGRLVSVSKDELGNTFEQVMDDQLNALETRLLPDAD